MKRSVLLIFCSLAIILGLQFGVGGRTDAYAFVSQYKEFDCGTPMWGPKTLFIRYDVKQRGHRVTGVVLGESVEFYAQERIHRKFSSDWRIDLDVHTFRDRSSDFKLTIETPTNRQPWADNSAFPTRAKVSYGEGKQIEMSCTVWNKNI